MTTELKVFCPIGTAFGDLVGLGDILDKERVETSLTPEVAAALEEICQHPRWDIDFLHEDDALTKAIYRRDGSGRIILPLTPEAASKGVTPRHTRIGDQKSQWHLEFLLPHTAISIDGMYGRCAYEDKRVAVVIAYLHDVAKKYTACTNESREISFYGHAQLSAYIAKRWLEQIDFFDDLTKNTIVAVIYGHDMIKYGGGRDKYYDELAKFGTRTNNLISLYAEWLSAADVAVDKIDETKGIYHIYWTEFDPVNHEKVPGKDEITVDHFDEAVERGKGYLKAVFD